MDWVPNTNHTGIYVALQKGWYKEAGIDLQILPYADGAIPDVLVGQGKADLGISGEDGVATYRAAGQPVVSIAAIIQHNTSGFAYLKDSGITRPRDLAGKRYAGFGAAYEEPVIAAIIKKDGGTDTKIQDITTNAGGYQAVAAKQADFVWIFAGWDGIQAKLDNVNLGMFFLKDSGIPDFYTPVIITSQTNVTAKAESLKAFMAATTKGYDYAIANPKDAADILMAANPKGTFSNPELVYESQAYLSPRYKDDASQWGQQTLDTWTGYPRFLFNNGVLQDQDGKPLSKELDYSSLFTTAFLPKK
jgi:ABC-type nitrate/sulfonate/bicarbonate transport system substrate-binding protein